MNTVNTMKDPIILFLEKKDNHSLLLVGVVLLQNNSEHTFVCVQT